MPNFIKIYPPCAMYAEASTKDEALALMCVLNINAMTGIRVEQIMHDAEQRAKELPLSSFDLVKVWENEIETLIREDFHKEKTPYQFYIQTIWKSR
jgi:hypothetical protein